MEKPIYLLKGAIILVVFTLVLGACKTETEQNNGGNEEYIEQIRELKEEVARLKKELGLINDEKPSNIIEPDFAQQLYNNYASTRVQWTNKYVRSQPNEKKFRATRSLYYDLDSLYNYLAYIRRISKEAGVKPEGLRFYFGSYSSKYVRNGSKDYAYRQTFFIAPTLPKVIGKDTLQLGYTLSSDYKVKFLKERIGVGEKQESTEGESMQKASMFNFSLMTTQDGVSTIANELNGSPPRG